MTTKAESAANMVVQVENDNCDNDICDQGRGAGNDHANTSETPGVIRTITTKGMAENLSDTLSKGVSRLCSICRNFYTGQCETDPGGGRRKKTFRDGNAIMYHPSLGSLMASVSWGCRLCKDLAKDLDEILKRKHHLQGTTKKSLSIWCEVQRRYWDGSDHYLGVLMAFDFRGQEEPLLRYGIKYLSFFPAADFGIGPEVRGEKPTFYIFVVLLTDSRRFPPTRNDGKV